MRLEVRPQLPAAQSRSLWAPLFLAALLALAFALAGCTASLEAPVRAEAPGPTATRPDAASGLQRPATPAPVAATPVTVGALVAAGLVPATPDGAATTPSPTPTLAPCETPSADEQGASAIYASGDDGYCLRYPAQMKPVVGGGQAHSVIFSGPGRETGGQEVQVSLLVEVQPAAGETLDQMIAGVLASYPPEVATGAVRQDARLGGQPAVVMEGLPGQLANRQAFVIFKDRLYHLVLSPFREPSMPDLQADAEAAWKTVTDSLTFVP